MVCGRGGLGALVFFRNRLANNPPNTLGLRPPLPDLGGDCRGLYIAIFLRFPGLVNANLWFKQHARVAENLLLHLLHQADDIVGRSATDINNEIGMGG